jgi:hypothetical protein
MTSQICQIFFKLFYVRFLQFLPNLSNFFQLLRSPFRRSFAGRRFPQKTNAILRARADHQQLVDANNNRRMENKLHTAIAALELGMTTQGVLKHIAAGNLRTERFGHVHVIDRAEFEEFKARYHRGEFDGRATR